MRGGMPGKRECKPQCALCRPSDLAPPLHFLAHHSSTADCWLPENCLQCNAGWCQTPPSPTRPSAPATRAAAGRRCMRPAGRGTSSVRQRCRVSAPAVLQQQQYSLIQRFHSIIFSAHPRLPPCPPPRSPWRSSRAWSASACRATPSPTPPPFRRWPRASSGTPPCSSLST